LTYQDSSLSENRQTGVQEIEITPEMIEAGAYAMRDFCYGEDIREVVKRVFYVMQAAND